MCDAPCHIPVGYDCFIHAPALANAIQSVFILMCSLSVDRMSNASFEAVDLTAGACKQMKRMEEEAKQKLEEEGKAARARAKNDWFRAARHGKHKGLEEMLVYSPLHLFASVMSLRFALSCVHSSQCRE